MFNLNGHKKLAAYLKKNDHLSEKLNGKIEVNDDKENPGELAILWIVSLMVEEMHFMRNATCTRKFCS